MPPKAKSVSHLIDENIKRHHAIGIIKSDGDKMICLKCSKNIEFKRYTIGARLNDHLSSNAHKINLSSSDSQLVTDLVRKQKKKLSAQDEFEDDMLTWFLETGMPLTLFRHPSTDKFIKKRLPSFKTPAETTMRRKVKDKADNIIVAIRDNIGESNVFIIVDETTDVKGRHVVNTLIGKIDGQPPKTMLIAVDYISTANSDAISDIILNVCKTVWPGEVKFPRLHLLISDQAPYMTSAGRKLKHMKLIFPNIHHITCIIHAINLVCGSVRKQFKLIDKFFDLQKKFFRISPLRQKKFLDKTKMKMIPFPILIRWASWLNCVRYHCTGNNFAKLKNFFLTFEAHKDIKSYDKICKILKGTKLEQDLSKASEYTKLIDIINDLQTSGLTVKEQRAKLSEVKKLIAGNKTHKQILQLSLKKNPDIDKFFDSMKLRDLIDKKFVPLTSVDVERSFSMYNNFLRKNRLRFTKSNLRDHLIVNFNSHM